MQIITHIHDCFLCKSVQFSSVTQSCPTLYDPMNGTTLGFPVHYQLPESTQTHVHWWRHPTISSSVIPFSSCPQTLPESGSFPMSQLSPHLNLHFFPCWIILVDSRNYKMIWGRSWWVQAASALVPCLVSREILRSFHLSALCWEAR